jgi:hypothetical protein
MMISGRKKIASGPRKIVTLRAMALSPGVMSSVFA